MIFSDLVGLDSREKGGDDGGGPGTGEKGCAHVEGMETANELVVIAQGRTVRTRVVMMV